MNLDRGFHGPIVLSQLNIKTVLHLSLVAIGGFLCTDTVTKTLLIVQTYLTVPPSLLQEAVNTTWDDQFKQALMVQPLYFILGFILMTKAYRIAPYLMLLRSSD